MTSINSSFFISGLRCMGSALKTPIKCISSFLSKLNCVTNSGTHSSDTEMLFQNRNNSAKQSMKSSCSQYTASSKTTAQSADEMQNLTRKRQAPQPPLALVTTLKPMLKEFQLRPDIAVERKPTGMRQTSPAPSPTKKRQAPLPPPLPTKMQQTPSSELISNLEQAIKADKQTSDGAAWHARYSNTAEHSPKVRRIPMPLISPALTAELEQMTSDAGLRIRNNSTGIIPTKVRHSLRSSVQIKKPEKMTENNKQSTSNIISPQQALQEELKMALKNLRRHP